VLIVSACVLGLAPILVRLADTGSAAAGLWRFVFAMPLLLLLTARPVLGSGPRMTGAGVGRPSKWMCWAALFFVLDLSFWHYSIAFTSVANATVLTNLTPVVVTLVAWVAFRERPRALFVVALALALAGAFAMSAGADGRQGTNPRLGDVFATVTALWYAGYFLVVKRARRDSSAGRIMLWSTGLGIPLLLAVSLALGEPLLPGSAGGWAAVAGLGVMHVVGQGGVAWALGRLPAALTAVTVLLQPVVAAVLGWVLFSEGMTPPQLLGGAAVLAGVVLAQWSSVKKKGAEAEAAAPVS
jgi:drug/metabolite transporter (DMT)-like permease